MSLSTLAALPLVSPPLVTSPLVTSPLITSVAERGDGWGPGAGLGWLFLLVPLFWIGLFALVFTLIGRRWRRAGWGPDGRAFWADPTRTAEASLGERFAQGDIDEKEYRSRLDVLRASRPQPQKR